MRQQQEAKGIGSVGTLIEMTSDHVNGSGSVLSVNLVGPTGENTTNNADVAFLWDVVDIDGVIGSHRGGNTFFQHNNSC